MIVADHDLSGVGQRYAEQASAKYGARMVMPPILGDANDYAQAGHNLVGLLMPIVMTGSYQPMTSAPSPPPSHGSSSAGFNPKPW
jgi:hypothetical protein